MTEQFRIRLMIEPIDPKSERKRYAADLVYDTEEAKSRWYMMMVSETIVERVRTLLSLFINQE
jgi:hypothetical protein